MASSQKIKSKTICIWVPDLCGVQKQYALCCTSMALTSPSPARTPCRHLHGSPLAGSAQRCQYWNSWGLRLFIDLQDCFHVQSCGENRLASFNYESFLCCCVSSRAFTSGARMPYRCFQLSIHTSLIRDGVWQQASLGIILHFLPFPRTVKLIES